MNAERNAEKIPLFIRFPFHSLSVSFFLLPRTKNRASAQNCQGLSARDNRLIEFDRTRVNFLFSFSSFSSINKYLRWALSKNEWGNNVMRSKVNRWIIHREKKLTDTEKKRRCYNDHHHHQHDESLFPHLQLRLLKQQNFLAELKEMNLNQSKLTIFTNVIHLFLSLFSIS